MIVFNQANNAITSVTFDGTNKTEVLTKYVNEVSTGDTSVNVKFNFTGREFIIFNTNATSGTIFADGDTSDTVTISANTTITSDTVYDGETTINDTYTLTVNDGYELTISGGDLQYNHDAIDFTAENLTKKDLYFDLGTDRVWTVSLTLNGSSNVEIGSIIGGSFTEYGFTTDLTNSEIEYQGKLSGKATAGNFKALRDYANSRDDYYVCIAKRSINDASLYAIYGKIQVKEQTIRGNSLMNSSNVQIDNVSIEVS